LDFKKKKRLEANEKLQGEINGTSTKASTTPTIGINDCDIGASPV
jgi:hypothetical protein